MHPSHLGFLAMEITRQREHEAIEGRRAAEAVRAIHEQDRIPPRGPLRSWLALAAAGVSRASAGLAIQLDEHLEAELRPRSRIV